MFGVASGHQGDRCTFEVLCDHFGIDDPRVRQIAKIVHDVDRKNEGFRVPEAPVIGRMVEGLRATYREDHDLLSHVIAMFAGLYGSLEAARPTPAEAALEILSKAGPPWSGTGLLEPAVRFRHYQ
jgi:hypothetical protein